MARDGGYDRGCMADCLSIEAQARDRVLVLPAEQRTLDRLGLARPCLCPDRSADCPGRPEHSRRLQERAARRCEGAGLTVRGVASSKPKDDNRDPSEELKPMASRPMRKYEGS